MTNQKELCHQCGAKLINGECPDCAENNNQDMAAFNVKSTKKTKSKFITAVVFIFIILLF